MAYRSRKVEKCVIDFYKALPVSLRRFAFDVKKAISTLKNCTVHSYQEFAQRHNLSVDEVVAYCESPMGCTHKERGNYIIMFNDSPHIAKERKFFTLAHELGHILLGHLVILENYKIFNSSHPNEHFERDANYFAASVFSPMPILSRLKPKSALAIREVFGLSFQSSEILFSAYIEYDKYHNIAWHNEILKLFDSDSDFNLKRNPVDIATYHRLAYSFEAGDLEPIISIPKLNENVCSAEITSPINLSEIESEIETEASISRELFEQLEHDWLYPKELALS